MVINKNLRFLRFLRESFGLEPQRSAALHGDGAKNAGDDGGDDLEDLLNSGPIQFHFFENRIKGFIIGLAESAENAENFNNKYKNDDS